MKGLAWLAFLLLSCSWSPVSGVEVVRFANASVEAAGHDGGLPEDEEEKPFDPYHKSNYKKETHLAGGVTAEACFAVLFVAILASVPAILFGLVGGQELTKAHMIESACLVLWLLTAVVLFTNVLTFQSGSGHWQGARSLTIAEAVYLLAQILTTVGYGDMTPATAFSQVWVAVNVILALCLYGSLISEAAGIASEKISDRMSKYWAKQQIEGEASAQAIREAQKPLKVWDDLKPPVVDYGNLEKSAVAFSIMVFIGVLFWHYFPGENKSWLQAVYFSVITLSTVGFGALTAVTPGGYVFGAFWMLFGVATLGGVLGSFVEIMFAYKAHQRMNADLSKLQFFKFVQDCAKPVSSLSDIGFEKYDFLKLGVLLSEMATEDELKVLEARFDALKGEDGKVSKDTLIQEEGPPGYGSFGEK